MHTVVCKYAKEKRWEKRCKIRRWNKHCEIRRWDKGWKITLEFVVFLDGIDILRSTCVTINEKRVRQWGILVLVIILVLLIWSGNRYMRNRKVETRIDAGNTRSHRVVECDVSCACRLVGVERDASLALYEFLQGVFRWFNGVLLALCVY